MTPNETSEEAPTPEISIVIPTYERADCLSTLLKNLSAQSLPTHRFEVVVVDNCSSDGTSEMVDMLAPSLPFRIRVVRTPVNRGPAAARNMGWKIAVAPLLAFLDDDVTPTTKWLETGLAAFEGMPTIGVIQGRTRVPAEEDHKKHRYGPPDWELYHIIESPTPYFEACNIFFRREVMEQTGGFDESIGWWGEDTAAGWKALEAGWQRGFAFGAMVSHPAERRGWRWFVRNGMLERNVIRLAVEYPGFRASAFWRPWAYRKEDAAFKIAVVAAIVGLRFRPALFFVLPYLLLQRPSIRHLNFIRLCWQIPLVDAARSVGQIRGALAYRVLVI